MGLLSGNPRSATCVVDQDAVVFVLSKARYAAVQREGGLVASVLRRALLSNLAMQLHQGNAFLRELVEETNKPLTPPTEEEVAQISGSLRGFYRR